MQDIPKTPLAEAIQSQPVTRPTRLWWMAVMAVFFVLGDAAILPTLAYIDPSGPGVFFQVVIGWEVGDIFAQMQSQEL